VYLRGLEPEAWSLEVSCELSGGRAGLAAEMSRSSCCTAASEFWPETRVGTESCWIWASQSGQSVVPWAFATSRPHRNQAICFMICIK
jgi:hypothetical protein